MEIEQLKSQVSAGGGFALANQYYVELPPIPGSSLSAKERNILCRATRIPGRQILTYDRQIGLQNQKIAYGHATAEIGLSFHVLNDYKTRDYFERWQNLIVDQNTQQIRYSDQYKFTVNIYQLKKGFLPLSYQQDFKIFGIGLNLNVEFSPKLNSVYGVQLEKAFPVTLNGIDLTDASEGQTVDLTLDLSYMNWQRIK